MFGSISDLRSTPGVLYHANPYKKRRTDRGPAVAYDGRVKIYIYFVVVLGCVLFSRQTARAKTKSSSVRTVRTTMLYMIAPQSTIPFIHSAVGAALRRRPNTGGGETAVDAQGHADPPPWKSREVENYPMKLTGLHPAMNYMVRPL